MIEVVYRVMKTKQFKGTDALKNAKKFCKEISKSKYKTEDIQAFNIRGTAKNGSTDGYWEADGGKWKWCELDG